MLLGAAPALANPPQAPAPRLAFRFEYTRGPGAESCPTEHTAHDLLMGAVSYDPVKPDAGPRAKIAVTRNGPKFHADIAIYDAAGELMWVQELDDPARCLALVRAAVVVVYSMMPRSPALHPPTEPLPPPPAAPPGPASARVPTRASAAPLLLNRPKYEVGLGPMVNFGLTPGWSAGSFLFLTLRWTTVSITGEARGLGSVTADTKQVNSGRQLLLRGQFYGIAGGPCVHGHPFFGCATLSFGALIGSAGTWVQVKTKDPGMFAPSLRFGAEGTLIEGFALRGFVEATAIVTRPRILGNEGERWRTPPVGASIGLALVVPVSALW